MDILICDDEPTALAMAKVIVTKMGHQAITVSSGNEALHILTKAHAPQVAILDWMLPDLSGVEICRQVRATRTILSLFILVVTGKRDPGSVVEGLNAGANDYVVKPYFGEELRARLSTGIRLIELQNEVQTLSGLLPICAWCKKIRDDANSWVRVEQYVQEHSEASFTHGVCPDCAASFRTPPGA